MLFNNKKQINFLHHAEISVAESSSHMLLLKAGLY
jgi:hypothetical protein